MNKLALASLLFSTFALFSMERANKITLQKLEDSYILSTGDEVCRIKNYMVDKSIRTMNSKKLAAVLNRGNAYLKVTKCSNGQYALDLCGRLQGGGPITAATLYWLTKVTCYGTAAAATAGAVVATGGTAGALLTGGLATGAGTIVAGGAGGMVVAGLTAEVGAGIVAGGLAAGALEGAGLVTVGAVTSAGGVAGAIAAVEAASCGAFAFGMMIPLP